MFPHSRKLGSWQVPSDVPPCIPASSMPTGTSSAHWVNAVYVAEEGRFKDRYSYSMNLEQKQAWMRERQQASGSPRGPEVPMPDFAVRHYTVAEIAKLWELSRDLVRRIFINEPDVLVLGADPKAGRRRYRTLRIPGSVAARVYKRLTNKRRTTC